METDFFPQASPPGVLMGMIVFAGSRWIWANLNKNGTLRWAGLAGLAGLNALYIYIYSLRIYIYYLYI